jgi:hypothetical protein
MHGLTWAQQAVLLIFNLPDPSEYMNEIERIETCIAFSGRQFVHSVDINDDSWHQDEAVYDLIHISMHSGKVKDWQALHRRAYKYLKPGGQIDLAELDWSPRSYGTLLLSCEPLLRWYKDMQTATAAIGMLIDYKPTPTSYCKMPGSWEWWRLW